MTTTATRTLSHVLCKRDEIYLGLISITKIPLVVIIRLRHLAWFGTPNLPSRVLLLKHDGPTTASEGDRQRGEDYNTRRRRFTLYKTVNIILCEYSSWNIIYNIYIYVFVCVYFINCRN